MKAMLMRRVVSLGANPAPLDPVDLPDPSPGQGEILIRVGACGVCHTELDEIEGRMPPPRLPVVLGHQVVGRVCELGAGVTTWTVGDRAGVGWIYSACGDCPRCRAGFENLCARFQATGRDANGGYAELMRVPHGFAYPLPTAFSDTEIAPLLCAGAIGYRSLRLANLRDGDRLGLTGFGASAHLVMKMVRRRLPSTEVFVFARSDAERQFARDLGAAWTGDTEDTAPVPLDAIIDTTPVWKPVVEALRNLAPGGRLVINAIRKEDVDKEALLGVDYKTHVWMEKEIKSVANVARRDVAEFLAIAAEIGLKPDTREYPLADANQALAELKRGQIRGAKVLRIS